MSARLPWPQRLQAVSWTLFEHATKHTGVGIVCAVAYFDPGNWGVDLQAGSLYGYKLLFIVLVSGLFAVFLQILASRLGCVTGLDLASHCRLLLHSRPKHTLLYRWLLLYPLYALSEIAIISTDLAELLGSAIALCMLFPRLPLWAGVLLTAADVVFLLALRDPLGGRPVRVFEYLIAVLVLIVLICMAIIIAKVDVDWADAFDGFVPSKTIFASGGLYTSVGILGATVMPHSLFLGSALATQDRLAPTPPPKLLGAASAESLALPNPAPRAPLAQRAWRALLAALAGSRANSTREEKEAQGRAAARTHAEWANSPAPFVRAHLYHGIADMAVSLLGFAVIINALILILASAVFFYGAGPARTSPASLFDAHDLIRDLVGKPAALLFALALLAAGQSSSIIATVAGQSVSEGFLRWRVSPVVRRLLTRLVGLVPAMAVAAAVGRPGIDALLVASQVALSVVLPFVTFPLIYLTSSRAIMAVREPAAPPAPAPASLEPAGDGSVPGAGAGTGTGAGVVGDVDVDVDVEQRQETKVIDYSSGKIATGVGIVIWLIMVAANAYVIITLALGEDS